MIGFIIAVAIVSWIGTILFVIILFCEGHIGPMKTSIAVFVLVILGLGYLINKSIEEKNSGPCVIYETQMHFNPATKTMMPARVCVNRGEWITN